MKVFNNDQLLFVGWRYDDPHKPTNTSCIVTNEERKVVAGVTVKRYYLDPCDKDKARRFSLAKLVTQFYPGKENKETRKRFWEAYLNRNKKPVEA